MDQKLKLQQPTTGYKFQVGSEVTTSAASDGTGHEFQKAKTSLDVGRGYKFQQGPQVKISAASDGTGHEFQSRTAKATLDRDTNSNKDQKLKLQQPATEI